MFTLPRLTARLAAVAAFAALLATACNTDSTGPSSPTRATLSANREGGEGGGTSSSGVSSSFAVLANAAVTCTDGNITGNVGTFLGTPPGAITFTNCPHTGSAQIGTGASIAAYQAFLTRYAALAPKAGDVCPLITGTLAGQNLAPGVYCVSAEAKTGTLTLTGSSSATWLIKVPAGALTGTSFTVVLAGGASACNVTWWVNAAATMTDSHLSGSILAGAAITLTRGTLAGNAFAGAAGVGDVTITGTTVVGCAGARKHHHRDIDKDNDKDNDKDRSECNQGVGNGAEGCDPGNSNHHNGSNDENGGTPGDPGRQHGDDGR